MGKIMFVILVFAFMILVEFAYGYFKKRNTYTDIKDAFSSLTIGISQAGANVAVSSILLFIDYSIYEYRIFDFGVKWYDILLLFLLMEFSFYWWQRASHRVCFLWANHVNHHPNKEYNFTAAFRQPLFSPVLRPLFYIYIPFLGFNPALIATIGIVSLTWNVLSHTQHIGKLGILEYINVTPSTHRVHHGTNSQYIDKNYGGVLIIFDILFGTYQVEKEKVVYGINKNVESYNPFKIIFHEWLSWAKDIKNSKSIKEAYTHTFSPPK
jgi:sterol desaturase/sphingolipid hydroxylase (fatty acid hydroxylase superfamily)